MNELLTAPAEASVEAWRVRALGTGRGDRRPEGDSAEDSAEDSFDGFEGLCTPGLPDFAPTRVPSLETPPASASAAPSPRSAAIRAEIAKKILTFVGFDLPE